MASTTSTANVKSGLLPQQGQLTYGVEGQEGGLYHSRKLHVPDSNSGLTIGRGYDMKARTTANIKTDFKAAGIDDPLAGTVAGAAGLTGDAAKKYITDNKLQDWEITTAAQLKLFEISYQTIEKDVTRICAKTDTVAAYGAVDWARLDPAIKDMVIDLRFRGDYTGGARKVIQKAVADNDLQAMTTAMTTKANWPNVPSDRYKQRAAFMERALAAKKAETPAAKTIPAGILKPGAAVPFGITNLLGGIGMPKLGL